MTSTFFSADNQTSQPVRGPIPKRKGTPISPRQRIYAARVDGQYHEDSTLAVAKLAPAEKEGAKALSEPGSCICLTRFLGGVPARSRSHTAVQGSTSRQRDAGYEGLARSIPPESGGTHSSTSWHACGQSVDEDKHHEHGDASTSSGLCCRSGFNINSSSSGGGNTLRRCRPTVNHR